MQRLATIERIVKRVRVANIGDPKNIMEALSKELKAEGIDPSKIGRLSDFVDDADTVAVSDFLDENLFAPFFSSQAGTFEISVLETIIQFGFSREIKSSLIIPKLFFASLAVLFFFGALFKYRFNPVYAAIYIVLAADSLRVSYNCYAKNYYSLAARKATRAPETFVSTVFKFAQQAVGAVPYEDPLKHMKEKVDWKILLENTVIRYIITQVRSFYLQAM
jgi:hypothetical protein